ncbi:MAG: ankyrin repeat domain-containing protein [Thiobacillaceae bacterium]
MRSFKWLLIGLLISSPALGFDQERDDWLLSYLPSQPETPHHRYEPLDFASISATGNDREPVYAEGKQGELITAAAHNDIKQVEALLKSGINPSAVVDQWGENALMHAVQHNNIEMTRLLLEAGANPNLKGRGFTPLGMAALQGRVQIVRLLLKAGADIDRKSNDGNTPIIAACIMHRADVVRELLAYHPDITIWNREGRVSLGIAVQEGTMDIVAMMLKAGVDPNVMDRNGNRPMSWSDGQHDIAVLLVAHGGSTF